MGLVTVAFWVTSRRKLLALPPGVTRGARALNRGDIAAPEAMLRRRLQISGKLMLALKLHLILG